MTMLAERPEVSELTAKAQAAREGDQRDYSLAVYDQEVEDYQLAWAEALKTEDRVVLVCLPDTRKSTTVQHTLEQIIGLDHEETCLWLMGTQDQATKRVLAIKETIDTNQVYREAFNVRPNTSARWTNNELFIQRSHVSPNPTLMATGFMGAYQGFHFRRIVVDDPTSEKDVRSPSIMEAQRHRLRGMLRDRLDDGGQIVVMLTRWGENDLLPAFRDMGFRVIQMPLISDKYPWGPTISPTRWPIEDMERFKQEKTERLFNLTYMCDTSALEGLLIKREHIAYWDNDMIPTVQMPIFQAVDPAASTKTSADYSAIATIGYDYKTRRMFLLDLWMQRVEVPDLRENIGKRAMQTVGLVALGVETVAFQLGLVQDLRRQYKLPLREIPYRTRRQVQSRVLGIDKDKTSRALYLAQLLTSGRLFIPKGLPLWDGVSLESMLMTYGTATNTHHDDGPDAIAFACALAEASIPQGTTVSISAGGL